MRFVLLHSTTGRCGFLGVQIDYTIRHYFKDRQLTKISSVSYTRNDKGDRVGWKVVLNIYKFSVQPDETLLSLPQGIKAKK